MKRIFMGVAMLTLIFSFQEVTSQSLRQMVKKKILKDNLEAQAKRDSARAVEEGREPDKSPNTTMNQVYLDALGLTGNVDYESSYKFDAYIQMEVSEYKKNEKLEDQVVYDTHISKERIDYAMVFKDESSKSTIIFDQENSAMLILTDSDGEKTGFAMGIDPETMAEMAEDYEEESGEETDADAYLPYKTGKKKEILGYTCEEYMVDDETGTVHMWVSEELGKKVRKDMLKNQQTFGAIFYHATYLNGMVMEYEYFDKEEEEKTILRVTDIDLNRSYSIATGPYAIMSMKSQVPEEEEED
ncbi:MAG: DUF4412 domain-containing protein [Bacteroidota bacterium]